jgi:hypothetical protein
LEKLWGIVITVRYELRSAYCEELIISVMVIDSIEHECEYFYRLSPL